MITITAQILAETAATTENGEAAGILGMTIGEAMVTISTFALVLVTGVMIWVSLLLVKVTQRANEIAMHDVTNVANNSIDSMENVATHSIDAASALRRPKASVAHRNTK